MRLRFLLLSVIDKVFLIYLLMLFARIIGSWFPDFQDHPFMGFLKRYTDPYLNFFRQFIPPIGMIDISPIIAFITLSFIEYGLKSLVILIFP